MASLTDNDIEKLFSGAPQYFARSEGHFTGAPHPSVAYPWDESLQIRDLTDHVQIEDVAWSNVTAWPHITRRCSSPAVAETISRIGGAPSAPPGTPPAEAGAGAAAAATAHDIKKRSHYYPRCRERPSMLSIQGLEKGTIGYEAALELAVSDALQEEQFGFDNFGSRPRAIREARKNLMDPVAAAATAAATAAAAAVTRAVEYGTGEAASAVEEAANGVKYVGETQILEELIKNGRRYADGSFYDPQQSKAFYNELFHHILRPPKRSRTSSHHKRSSSQGSGGTGGSGNSSGIDIEGDLIPQIEALLEVLATPNVWIDFSHVEWRLRLGQVLWASSPEDDLDPGCGPPQVDGGSIASGGSGGSSGLTGEQALPASADERYTERYWLLLQILLATELLLRLDAITDGDEDGLEYVRPTEVHRFEKVANPSVRWSLILARAWLENIEVVRIGGDADDETPSKTLDQKADKTAKEKPAKAPALQSPANASGASSASSTGNTGRGTSRGTKHEISLRHTIGWITTLTRKITLIEGRLRASKVPEKKHVYAMKAKNAPCQYRGVAHFAQELKWPNDLTSTLSQRALNSAHIWEPLNAKITKGPESGCATPPSTGPRNSLHATIKAQLEFSRRLPRRRKVVAGLHPGGWLSRSYLSGLILPGDGLCNLLMSTLLEGDDAALQTLGSVAHLGAGFVYGGKSFWSTVSVVGRVLAAGAGAAECMGWVSSDVLPQGLGEGWFNVDADDVADDMRMTNRRARIWGKTAIERESSVLGDADPESVLPADFVIPFEAVYKETPPKHTRIDLQQFELCQPFAPAQSAEKPAGDSGPDPAGLYVAKTAFAVSSEGRPNKTVQYNLSYDVYFVTAHPCVPSQRVKVVKSPSSPTIQQVDVSGDGPSGRSNTIHATGHPLHKYFKYASIHLTTLIENPEKSLEQLLREFAASTNRSSAAATAEAAAAAAASGTSATATSSSTKDNAVLVVDCITGFSPQPAADEMPLSPVLGKKPFGSFFDELSPMSSSVSSLPPLTKEISPMPALSSSASPGSPSPVPASLAAVAEAPLPAASPAKVTLAPAATSKMHHETRRRRFGSDMEILVRALCAERGWNALISRRRRGCLACAIREAGALGWRVVIRVD